MDISFHIPAGVVAAIGATLIMLILLVVGVIASSKKKLWLFYGVLGCVGLLAWGCVFELLRILAS